MKENHFYVKGNLLSLYFVSGKEQSDEFTVKVAKTQEEIKSLLEVGFDYVCQKDGLAFFRKRK